jgi:hypothetical protein
MLPLEPRRQVHSARQLRTLGIIRHVSVGVQPRNLRRYFGVMVGAIDGVGVAPVSPVDLFAQQPQAKQMSLTFAHEPLPNFVLLGAQVREMPHLIE